MSKFSKLLKLGICYSLTLPLSGCFTILASAIDPLSPRVELKDDRVKVKVSDPKTGSMSNVGVIPLIDMALLSPIVLFASKDKQSLMFGIAAGITLVDLVAGVMIHSSRTSGTPGGIHVIYESAEFGKTEIKLPFQKVVDSKHEIQFPLSFNDARPPIQIIVLSTYGKELTRQTVYDIPVSFAKAQPLVTGQVERLQAPATAHETDDIQFTGTQDPDSLAVVVGIESYGEAIPPVPYAQNDARKMREYLIKKLGVPAPNVIHLTNEQATNTRLRVSLERQLKQRVKPGVSHVYVYLAGHGTADQNKGPYFVPVDGDPADPAGSCYPLSEMYRSLASLGAKSTTVVIDSCFSGSSGREEKPQSLVPGTRPIGFVAKGPIVPSDLTIFTATSANQLSSGLPNKQHGLMTYFFMKGLAGSADIDGNRQVTVSEMKQYLELEVPKEARRMRREQTPTFFGEPQDQTRILSTY